MTPATTRSTKLRGFLAAALALSVLVTWAVFAGLANAVAVPVVRGISLPVQGLPAGTPPIKVALLSDIHLGNRGMQPQRLFDIADQVNAAHPDLILIAGDFLAGHDAVGAVERAHGLTAPLARLKATYGVVAVLGNHDLWTAPAAIRSALRRAGVTILENQAVRRGPLTIVGVGDRFSGNDDVPRALAEARRLGGAPVVLTHSPDLAPHLPAAFPLLLAGHTHCGQVVIPWVGPAVTRAPRYHWRQLYSPRYRCGLVREGNRITIVTAGLGLGTAPIRLGAMPDWWLLTFHP
jgi:hypothetical protein